MRRAGPVAAGEEGVVRVGGEAGAEQEEGHHREHRRRARFFVKPATTTSLTRREPTRSLVLSCAVSPP
jgi:hypothetical protein